MNMKSGRRKVAKWQDERHWNNTRTIILDESGNIIEWKCGNLKMPDLFKNEKFSAIALNYKGVAGLTKEKKLLMLNLKKNSKKDVILKNAKREVVVCEEVKIEGTIKYIASAVSYLYVLNTEGGVRAISFDNFQRVHRICFSDR
eukprot:UN02164